MIPYTEEIDEALRGAENVLYATRKRGMGPRAIRIQDLDSLDLSDIAGSIRDLVNLLGDDFRAQVCGVPDAPTLPFAVVLSPEPRTPRP
jgi:hypothetical protein